MRDAMGQAYLDKRLCYNGFEHTVRHADMRGEDVTT
jgi:hypothetical protein